MLDFLKKWENSTGDPVLEDGAVSLIFYLAEKLFEEYEPSAFQPFLLKLDKWLSNVPDDNDRKLMITLLSKIFFVGRREFDSLYRSAFSNISRWAIEKGNVDLGHVDFSANLKKEIGATWICPVTDSLRINGFLKVNGIEGHDHRPHWRSLAKFADIKKIQAYIDKNYISRVALIEDFVGSGSQIEDTIDFGCGNFPKIDFMISPLIICPDGHRNLKKKALIYKNLSYQPVLSLPKNVFLKEKPVTDEPPIFAVARDFINRIGGKLVSPKKDHFGFGKTGALTVLFSNCPDNTLPIFRDDGATWSPLFPRVWRPE